LDRIEAGKEMLVRIVAMLTKLLMRFDPEQYRVQESAAGLATPFEHEYPGKAGLFWVRHEHIFQLKPTEFGEGRPPCRPIFLRVMGAK
jgi:hypothetical protein